MLGAALGLNSWADHLPKARHSEAMSTHAPMMAVVKIAAQSWGPTRNAAQERDTRRTAKRVARLAAVVAFDIARSPLERIQIRV